MTTHPATIQDVAQGPALAVALAGAHWNGVQHGRRPADALAIFTDPVTHSTLALPLAEVTIGNVSRALAAKRAEYRTAMLEAK
jgi:hypothetical protein